jgi:hypothetical protein
MLLEREHRRSCGSSLIILSSFKNPVKGPSGYVIAAMKGTVTLLFVSG